MCPDSAIAVDVAKAFGGKLREAPSAATMTQERLGQLSNVDRTEIGRLEAGVRVPRLDTGESRPPGRPRGILAARGPAWSKSATKPAPPFGCYAAFRTMQLT